jgi:2-polyprenyl-6-methoxyphenol hydroxylase-like FAD-dependent oxidoreductase
LVPALVGSPWPQTDASGAYIDHHDFRPANGRYAPTLGITRDGLMSALSAGLSFPVAYATTVSTVDWSKDSPVVAFSDDIRAQFDLVVGADGIQSAVRKVIFPEVAPIYRSFCAWHRHDLHDQVAPGHPPGQAHAFPPLLAQGAAMAIEDAVTLAELIRENHDLDEVLRSYEAARRPRLDTIRAAVRRVTVTRVFEGPVTLGNLERRPPVFSNSLKVYT